MVGRSTGRYNVRQWVSRGALDYARSVFGKAHSQISGATGRPIKHPAPQRLSGFVRGVSASAAASGVRAFNGDAHYQNFLIARDGTDCRIIDWEDWELAPATDDLAFLMAVLWFAERRQRLEQTLLRRYHESLTAAGVKNYSWVTLWTDYRLSVVKYLCKPLFQWVNGVSTSLWWDNLERVLTSYEDLGCAEIMAQLKKGEASERLPV